MKRFSLKTVFSWLLRMVQGALIGTGAILPGVSGGVLCVAFGVYEPMMELLSHPFRTFKKNVTLFIPIVLGGLIGFVLLARAVEWMLEVSAVLSMALFAGLICGAIPQLFRQSVEKGPKAGWSSFVISLAAAFCAFSVLRGGIEGSITPNFAWFLFCGVIWGLSMVIPGLNSSSILLYMGLYQPMTAGIASLDFAVLIPLGIGFLATILLSAKLINLLFERFYGLMSRIILGFVIASTLMIFPTGFADLWQAVGAVLCFAAGFAVARIMDRCRTRQEAEA